MTQRATRPHSSIALLLALLAVGCGATTSESADAARAGAGGPGDAAVTPVEAVNQTPPAGYAWVIFGADTVLAEVAATPDERSEGLMYRESVPDGTGMLFVFQDVQVRSFWMANTYVALDIAYLDTSYNVVDIVAMEPLVTDSYPSKAPAMFGLEVRQGWFEENGIGVGAKANIVFGAVPRGG